MTKKQQVHRLEDLLVEEVSIVDRPANKRPFLMVKSEAGHGAEVVPGSSGELVTDPAKPAAPAPAAPPTAPDPAVVAQVEKMMARIEKGLALAPDVRRELFSSLRDGMQRVHAVMNLADAAPVDYEGTQQPSALVPLFASELSEAATAIAAAAKKMGKLTKNEPDPEPGVDIEKGLTSLVEGLETEIQKRGAKMSSARLGKFKEALGLLSKLLEELDAGGKVEPEKGRTAKSETPAIPVEVTKTLETATGAIEHLKATVKKQAQEIRTLKEARPASNAIPVDTSEPAPRAPEKVTWPRDMNA